MPQCRRTLGRLDQGVDHMDGTAAARGTRAQPAAARQPLAAASSKTINLALQGGGAHGAFTWGVLDRLLEDERIAFEGSARPAPGR